jgi:hypothetical protein
MHNVITVNADYFGFDKEESDFPIEIHFTRMGECDTRLSTNNTLPETIPFKNKHAFKVFMCSNEPSSSINRELNSVIIKNSFQYDLVLTTEEEVLRCTPNSILFPYGGTWLGKKDGSHKDSLGVFDENNIQNLNKKFQISFLTTSHLGKSGYYMRQTIWNNKHVIKIPSVFYSSTRFPTTNVIPSGFIFSNTLHDGLLPNDDKMHLWNSQFNIAIESSKEKSYFTEKIIDCLLTKTVPIYFGCDNIGEFFDVRGILQFNTFEEYCKIIDSIDETTYEKMKPYIEINYERAKEYGRSLLKRICEISKKTYEERQSKTDKLWTIGILTVPERREFLDRLLKKLNDTMMFSFANRIEVIVNSDNKIKTVGQKRNEIIDSANGKYLCFIDDDDIIGDYYISKIVWCLQSEQYDAVSFYGMYYNNGIPTMSFHHSSLHGGHFKKDGIQYRPLNHLNPILTNYAKQIRFPEKNYAEDSDYCDRLLKSGLVKNETGIPFTLYHYLFDSNTTLTQR